MNDIKELCQGFGWIPIHSKNKYMISFQKEESKRRLNIYFTTMTVTIEDDDHRQHHFKNVTLEEMEKILTKDY